MSVFIVLLIVVVIFFVVRQQNKNKKAIEKLKNGAGYAVAVEIKDELSRKGFKIDDLSIYLSRGQAVGRFTVYPELQPYSSCGIIIIAGGHLAMFSEERLIREKNDSERINYYHAIENANIGLLVRSDEKSQRPPVFIEIAAEVIKNSGYNFEHPDWLNEDSEQYLNVPFQ